MLRMYFCSPPEHNRKKSSSAYFKSPFLDLENSHDVPAQYFQGDAPVFLSRLTVDSHAGVTVCNQ